MREGARAAHFPVHVRTELGEKRAQLCRHEGGLAFVVGGGVARAAQRHPPGIRQDPTQAVKRGRQVLRALGPAEKENRTAKRGEPLQRARGTHDGHGVVVHR